MYMLQKILTYFVKLFLLLLPFQTVWIYDEMFLNGVKSQWGTSGFYVTEGLLWVSIILFIICVSNHIVSPISRSLCGIC